MLHGPGTLEIGVSPWKGLGLVALGILMTTLSVAIALRLLPNVAPGSFHEFAGYVGSIFFGLATGIALWQMIGQRGAVITISPEGIRDRRVAAEIVPWLAVRGISTWQYRGQKVMVLAIDPVVESGLTLTPIARWSRSANRALGADGLCITAQGLKISYASLLQTSIAYAEAARGAG